MAVSVRSVAEVCAAAKRAARTLAGIETEVKDAALEAIAVALVERESEVLAANEQDMRAGREAGLDGALLDRLALDAGRLAGVADAVRGVKALPDPVGEEVEGRRLRNGLLLRSVRVPLGVVAVVYEARPNVTIDAAALCLKSGNAVVLRGSSMAASSNAVLASIAAQAAEEAGLPAGCVGLVEGGDRSELADLATQVESVDLIVPRGGEGLKQALLEVASVPVIYAASGNCHVYVDAAADLEMAGRIVLNAKIQRPGVCNAAETLLVDRGVAERFLPAVCSELVAAGVRLRMDERGRALVGALGGWVESATEDDWEREYLSLIMAVKVVDGVEDAMEHIAAYGSGHSEAIVTGDLGAARRFQAGVDAACVYVNASTRFTDGGELGMGAEIGNSTQKLHARGPIGLRELCTVKHLVEGEGHIRA